jgi:hypothetical protein
MSGAPFFLPTEGKRNEISDGNPMLGFATTAYADWDEVIIRHHTSSNCSQLWYQRNQIFKEAGYCFNTQRGVRAFGNAGCQYDSQADVPLSDNDRDTVNQIEARERAQGCK